MLTDEQLVEAAADVAELQHAGHPVAPSHVSLLAAIAATRDEQRRHELARQAQARAEARIGQVSAVALELLRAAVFLL